MPDSAGRPEGGILGTGEQTSPGAGDLVRKVDIGLCLKQSDASEPEKYQKDYTSRPRGLTFPKAQPDFRGPESNSEPASNTGGWC